MWYTLVMERGFAPLDDARGIGVHPALHTRAGRCRPALQARRADLPATPCRTAARERFSRALRIHGGGRVGTSARGDRVTWSGSATADPPGPAGADDRTSASRVYRRGRHLPSEGPGGDSRAMLSPRTPPALFESAASSEPTRTPKATPTMSSLAILEHPA